MWGYLAAAAAGAILGKSSAKGAKSVERDPAEDYANMYKLQTDIQRGTGRFADLGPQVELEAEFRRPWLDLEASTYRKAAESLGDTYEEVTQPMLSRTEATSRRYQREADLADVERLGPRAVEASLSASPELREALEQQLAAARSGMDRDKNMRRFREAVRTGQAARGMVYSPYAAAEEGYLTSQAEEQMDWARQANLGTAIGQYSAFVNPYQQVLGRPGQTFSAMGGYGGQAAAMGQSAFQPRVMAESQLFQDILAGNQQTAMAAQQARSMQRTGMMSGLMGLGGSALMGAGSAGGFGNLFGGGASGGVGGGGGGFNPQNPLFG